MIPKVLQLSFFFYAKKPCSIRVSDTMAEKIRFVVSFFENILKNCTNYSIIRMSHKSK